MRAGPLQNSLRDIFADRNSLIFLYLLESEQNVRNRTRFDIQNIQPGEKTKEDSSLY
jgi:hypothetical protein